MKNCLAVFVSAVMLAVFGDNLVPEGKRDFDVPFKGEGKMGMVYTLKVDMLNVIIHEIFASCLHVFRCAKLLW